MVTIEHTDQHRRLNSGAYKQWVERVHNRAYNGCERCGTKNAKYHAHHTVPVSIDPEKVCDPNNGMLLCIPCHIEVHRLMKTILSQAVMSIDITEGATTTEVSLNNNLPQETPTHYFN